MRGISCPYCGDLHDNTPPQHSHATRPFGHPSAGGANHTPHARHRLYPNTYHFRGRLTFGHVRHAPRQVKRREPPHARCRGAWRASASRSSRTVRSVRSSRPPAWPHTPYTACKTDTRPHNIPPAAAYNSARIVHDIQSARPLCIHFAYIHGRHHTPHGPSKATTRHMSPMLAPGRLSPGALPCVRLALGRPPA